MRIVISRVHQQGVGARPIFSLTMQDLFGLNPIPEGVDPEHKIVLSFGE